MQVSESQSAQPKILLSDHEAAQLFGVSLRTFADIQREDWFPKPVLLGPRLKRHIRAELEAAVADMPRAAPRPMPAELLRGRIERQKKTGVPA